MTAPRWIFSPKTLVEVDGVRRFFVTAECPECGAAKLLPFGGWDSLTCAGCGGHYGRAVARRRDDAGRPGPSRDVETDRILDDIAERLTAEGVYPSAARVAAEWSRFIGERRTPAAVESRWRRR